MVLNVMIQLFLIKEELLLERQGNLSIVIIKVTIKLFT